MSCKHRKCTQGPIHFDENGVRDTAELRVLQYRTGCVEKEAASCGRIKLVQVAHILNEDGRGLQFMEEDGNNIWPGYCSYYWTRYKMRYFGKSVCMYT